jgi:vacuolar-type H+-ATPase subunit E/Vma4
MNGMENINSAIREKVNADANAILAEAGERAKQLVQKARDQRESKFQEEKSRLVDEAQTEASRIQAQGAIRARQEMLAVKTSIIDGIINDARKQLAGLSGNEKILANLTREGVNALGSDKFRVYVAQKDMAAMQKLVREDKELAGRVIEIKIQESLGGVIVEDAEGKNRIDNTFESRLEMLLPKLLPQIEKELT